jgi:hypothetical protein
MKQFFSSARRTMGFALKFWLVNARALPKVTAYVLILTGVCQAKELGSRLGVGFRNTYSFDLPAVAVNYYPSSDFGVIGALGIDTAENNSKSAFTGGVRRIIFKEENMNFFMSGILSFLSSEANGSTDSGFELSAVVGGEIFLHGLENLGLNFEAGAGVTNVKKVRFRTIGDHLFRSGIIFYF